MRPGSLHSRAKFNSLSMSTLYTWAVSLHLQDSRLIRLLAFKILQIFVVEGCKGDPDLIIGLVD